MWLKERGVEVSYPRVVQYTREFRRKKEKAYHSLNFLPGEEGQVDWPLTNKCQGSIIQRWVDSFALYSS